MSMHHRLGWGAFALVALVTGTMPGGAVAQQPPATTGERAAQTPSPVAAPQAPAPRRATVAASIDFASAYMFRGIYQEDHGLVTQPLADLGLTVMSGDGALKSVVANLGTWSSVHSGPTSTWYEHDMYAGATFTLGHWKPGALYTSYTSPNDRFSTVQEIAFSVGYDDSGSRLPFSPKVLVAFELDGQADGGANEGTYMELSVRPVVALAAPISLAFPLKVGLSLNDYYEGASNDTFGYVDVGAIASVPLPFLKGATWDVHGGLDVLFLGNTLEALNGGKSVKPVFVLGLGAAF